MKTLTIDDDLVAGNGFSPYIRIMFVEKGIVTLSEVNFRSGNVKRDADQQKQQFMKEPGHDV